LDRNGLHLHQPIVHEAMRIALALSGLARLHPISAASWGRIIGRYSPDVYVHSWEDAPGTAQGVTELINWVFKPTAVSVDPQMEIDITPYPDRHWPCIDVYRSLSMWHGIRLAHELVRQSGKEYNLIIRGRMDWHVHRLDIAEFNGLVLPFDHDKIPLRFSYRGADMHGYNDHFAYGPPSFMDLYVKTLDEIQILYATEGVDYCPENFLAASLCKQGVPVMLQHMEHKLIRG